MWGAPDPETARKAVVAKGEAAVVGGLAPVFVRGGAADPAVG